MGSRPVDLREEVGKAEAATSACTSIKIERVPLDRRDHDRAGDLFHPLFQKDLRRIGDLGEALCAHLKESNIVGGTETIFNGAHDPVAVLPVPFKIEHSSTMCSKTRGPAISPDLVTWPMRKVEIPRPLAMCMHSVAISRTWVTEPGRRGELALVDDLNRIDDQDVGLEVVDVDFDVGKERFAEQIEMIARRFQPMRARSEVCSTDSSPQT